MMRSNAPSTKHDFKSEQARLFWRLVSERIRNLFMNNSDEALANQ